MRGRWKGTGAGSFKGGKLVPVVELQSFLRLRVLVLMPFTNQPFFLVHHLDSETYSFRPNLEDACMLSRFSRVQLFATPWTVPHQAPLSMGFSKQEYWGPGIKPVSLTSPPLLGRFCTISTIWEAPVQRMGWLNSQAWSLLG